MAKTKVNKVVPICPKCGDEMTSEGLHTIADVGGDWDVDAERFVCPNGHTVFVADSDSITEAEVDDFDDPLDDDEMDDYGDEDEDDDEEEERW